MMQYKNVDKIRLAIAQYVFNRELANMQQFPSVRGANEDRLRRDFLHAFRKEAGLDVDVREYSNQEAVEILLTELRGFVEPQNGLRITHKEEDGDSINITHSFEQNNQPLSDELNLFVGKEYNSTMSVPLSSFIPYQYNYGQPKKPSKTIKAIVKHVGPFTPMSSHFNNALYILTHKMLFVRFLDGAVEKFLRSVARFSIEGEYNRSVYNFNKKYFGYSIVTLTRRRVENIIDKMTEAERTKLDNILPEGHYGIVGTNVLRKIASDIKKEFGDAIDTAIKKSLMTYRNENYYDDTMEVAMYPDEMWQSSEEIQEQINAQMEEILVNRSAMQYANDNNSVVTAW